MESKKVKNLKNGANSSNQKSTEEPVFKYSGNANIIAFPNANPATATFIVRLLSTAASFLSAVSNEITGL